MTNRGELPDRFYLQGDRAYRLNIILKGLAKEVGLAKSLKHKEILSHWRDIIGEEDYKHTQVVELKKGCLYTEVDSASLLHHLKNFCKEDILRELQTRCKNTFITDVKFKLNTGMEG
ncbi:MAG TPA: DUF721 domain-containing protein [Candidatus Brocadiia bacterium]|nr:DUF721 domain-containing protein [Planctomycetota bacterium]MDO8092679.1 DUF721 domain-containing protein [Candidatus Brocadiales bacterium]